MSAYPRAGTSPCLASPPQPPQPSPRRRQPDSPVPALPSAILRSLPVPYQPFRPLVLTLLLAARARAVVIIHKPCRVLELHPHHLLVCAHGFVSHLQGKLKSHVGLLGSDHRLVNIDSLPA